MSTFPIWTVYIACSVMQWNDVQTDCIAYNSVDKLLENYNETYIAYICTNRIDQSNIYP